MKFKDYLVEEMIFTEDDLNALYNKLDKEFKKIGIPFYGGKISRLGGKGREVLMLHLSLDKKEDWDNNIFENSRYMRFSVRGNTGVVEQFALDYNIKTKFRKYRAKNVDAVVKKISDYLKKVIKQ